MYVALTLILLTGPGGQFIKVNPDEVVSLRAPRSVDHMPKTVHCIIFTTDTKFIGVQESCDQAGDKLRCGQIEGTC
jgi:hypothetical protein